MKGKGFIFTKRGALPLAVVIVISMVISLNTVSLDASGAQYNYAKALQYSLFFFDANMCGEGVDQNSLYDWRGNCHVYDAKLPLDSQNTNMSNGFISSNKNVLDPNGNGWVDVSGGFHDAGDHVKFGLPEAYSASTVGWGYYEFREQYEQTNQAAHTETILRYFNDYFMKCTFRDNSGKVVAFCYQVGDGDIDHAYWNAPEKDSMFRRGWFATSEKPSTDVVMATAASLAVNYLNFKDTDPQYAAKNLDYAKALFEFGEKNGKAVGVDGTGVYYSSSDWKDDYCWAAAWLYLATQNSKYLDEAFRYYDYYAAPYWTHCWNTVWVGAACLLAEINDLYDKNSQQFEDRYKQIYNINPYVNVDFWEPVEELGEQWMNGRTPKTTGAGYAFLNEWGSARYNTATQFALLVYDKHHGDRPSKYGNWARGQMEYLMGKNPLNRCYIVGYNSNSAKYPHHRASSGLLDANDPSPQKYVLYGALVGGPDGNDQHNDTTADYIYNEVTIDYNAAFVGACAGLYRFFGDSTMQIDPSMPSSGTMPDPGKPEILYGDLNCDGEVNTLDFALMRGYVLNSISEFDAPIEAADLDGDGRTDALDLTLLKRYILRRISKFPVEG